MRSPTTPRTLTLALDPAPRSNDRSRVGGAAARVLPTDAPASGVRPAGSRAGTTLRALAHAQEVLLAPHAFVDDVAWRAALAEALGALFGA